MTEYDPLAKAITEAFEDVDVAYDMDIPEWKLADWQAAAKAAREFIAAEDDGWVEVSGPQDVLAGDEVWTTFERDGIKTSHTGIAHHPGTYGDWFNEQDVSVIQQYGEDQIIRVRRTKPLPPSASLIIAYELEGVGDYPEGIAMARILAGGQKGMYFPVNGDVARIYWYPADILRYKVATAVVDG